MEAAATAAIGSRILGEIEEMSLEEVLKSIQTASSTNTYTPSLAPIKITHIPQLDDVSTRHFRTTQAPNLSIGGRHLPLLYKLASHLVLSENNYALIIIDLDGQFDPTRLSCSDSDSRHIYIQQPARPPSYAADTTQGVDSIKANAEYLRSLVSDASNFMLYNPAARQSATRKWWGTIVIGGLGAGDVVAGWKGWLRVDREVIPRFAPGTSAKEAMEKRQAHQQAVEAAGWSAHSQWGGFVFHEETRSTGSEIM